MRSAVSAAALALVVVACGSPAEQAISGPDSTTSIPATTSTTTSTPAPTTTGGTVPGERPPDDEQSESGDQAYPEDGFPPDEDESVRLSIEDALLPDDAFGAPWELQWRELKWVGYGAGPNQTDCDEYWAYEELLGGDGGHAMWWIDGGNANHRVVRLADEIEALPRLLEIAMIAENCPVVRWNEGGEFRVEVFTPDVEAIVMRFTDEGSGEITWVAVTLFGDLLSVLQIPLWTRADGTMIEVDLDEVTLVAAQMFQRLQDAGPEPTPSTPIIVPSPVTTLPPPTTTVPVPSPTTTAPVPTTTVVIDDLGRQLLAADELPAGWQLDGVSEYSAGEPEEEIVEVCPAAESLNVIDLALRWEAEFSGPSDRRAAQLLGQMADEGIAAATVRQFAEVGSCDLDVMIPESVSSGGLVDVDGADAAATLFIEAESEGLRIELGAVAVGSTVAVFTLEGAGSADEVGAELLELMTLGVAKIATG